MRVQFELPNIIADMQGTADLFLENRVKKKSGHQVGFAEARTTLPPMAMDARYKGKRRWKNGIASFNRNLLTGAVFICPESKPFLVFR